MRITKLFLTIAFPFLLTPVFAGNEINPNADNELRTEMVAILQKNLSDQITEENFTINFIITNQNEIIVSSTSNKNFDQLVKSVLNYKKIKTEGLTPFMVYTLPVKLKK